MFKKPYFEIDGNCSKILCHVRRNLLLTFLIKIKWILYPTQILQNK